MTFISYAQNFEDVIIYRALKDIEQGFYIDVGANDPVIDSVTKAFYDMGWHGINIEPVYEWFKKLEYHRPRDTNLQLAVGASESNVNLFEIPNTGLSTTDEKIAARHLRQHDYDITVREVPIKTLTKICEDNNVSEIHFLKIDVEGGEKSVLEGIDFKLIRPWILSIEATEPNSSNQNYEDWEYLLLDSSYEFVYFDGLNRFYIAKEHSSLGSKLALPPNVFDDFQLASTVYFCSQALSKKQFFINQLESKLEVTKAGMQKNQSELKQASEEAKSLRALTQNLEDELREKQFNLDEAREKIKNTSIHINELEAQLTRTKKELTESHANSHFWWMEAMSKESYIQQLHTSTSWRITYPVRAVKRLCIFLISRLINKFKSLTTSIIKLVMRVALKCKMLNKIKLFLRRYPNLYTRIQLFAENQDLFDTKHAGNQLTSDENINSLKDISETEFSEMTPRARYIYTQLKVAIKQNRVTD